MSEYETRITRTTVAPAGEPIFHERATEIYIDDEAGGEYVVIEQHGNGMGKVSVNPDEWPTLRKAIDAMAKRCRP